jgi:hypothetical protein
MKLVNNCGNLHISTTTALIPVVFLFGLNRATNHVPRLKPPSLYTTVNNPAQTQDGQACPISGSSALSFCSSNYRLRVAESRMKSIRNILSRSLLSLRKQPFPAPPPGNLLPQDEPIDEEVCPGYDSTNFYPLKPGDVLANRYQALVKVGWGGSSTVWFARDLLG